MELELRLLGEVTGSFGGEPLDTFRSNKTQALLFYLVAEAALAGEPPARPRDQLMTLLWPGTPQKSAQVNLRQTLYQLRKLIPAVDGRETDEQVPLLLSDRQVVQINPEAKYYLDLAAFLRLLEGAPVPAELIRAVDLYRGAFLTDFYLPDSEPFESWASRRRAALQRMVLSALEQLAAHALEQADFEQAERYARRQLALDDLRESGHRQLLRALARSGHRSAALVHYEEYCALLKRELGAPPSPLVEALYETIRDGTLLSPEPPPPVESPQSQTNRIGHNLPRQTTFIGRHSELDLLLGTLSTTPASLVTITGPGGAGKTSLALAAGHRMLDRETEVGNPFADGIYFVPLASLTTAEEIPGAIAAVLDYRLPGEKPAQSELIDMLHASSLLLILDNFEHLATGAALLRRILGAAPAVKICVTSRYPLELSQEAVLPLAGLTLPADSQNGLESDAAQLFVHSARRVRLGYKLPPAELPHVLHICRLVGGMPLAIKLAAGWVDTLTPAEIAQEIQQDLDFLAAAQADVPERQRSMRATFAYTWRLLEPAEQNAMARLAVFRGGFTRQAAKAVVEMPLQLLARLVSKALLQFDGDTRRYQMHPLLRQFALEKLAGAGDMEGARRQHSHYFLQVVTSLEPELKGRDQKAALEAIRADIDNIRAAWRQAVDGQDLANLEQSVSGLHLWATLSDHLVQISTPYRYALEHLPARPDTDYLHGRILNRLYNAQAADPDLEPAELERLLTLFRQQSDLLEIYISLGNLTAQLYRDRNFARAREVVEERTATTYQLDDPFFLSIQLIRSGFYNMLAGNSNSALEHIHEGLRVAREAGNLYGIVYANNLLAGHATLVSGEYETAAAYAQETETLSRELRLDFFLGSALSLQAFHTLIAGNLQKCADHCRQLQKLASKNSVHQVRAHICSGILLAVQGNYEAAEQHLGKVPALTYNARSLIIVHAGLSLVGYGRGDPQRAAPEMLSSMKILPLETRVTAVFIWFLPVLAGIMEAHGEEERALELLALGRAHPACPHGWWDNWSLLDKLETRLRSRLPASAYTEAQARGRSLKPTETALAIQAELEALLA